VGETDGHVGRTDETGAPNAPPFLEAKLIEREWSTESCHKLTAGNAGLLFGEMDDEYRSISY